MALVCVIVFKKGEELLDVLLTDLNLGLFCVGRLDKGLFEKPQDVHQPEERQKGKATCIRHKKKEEEENKDIPN